MAASEKLTFVKPYHEETSSEPWSMWRHHSPKTLPFEGSKSLLDLCLDASRIVYFWYVLESIHRFIIELHVLQCLFIRESNKKQIQSTGRIISYFTRRETFSSLMITKCFGGNLTKWFPFLHLSVWPRTEYTWTLNWKQSLLIFLKKLLGCSIFSRVGMGWWTLL